jgi:hypothetical protein
MLALSLVSIFHFSINFPVLVALIGTLAVLLLIITPIQLVFRMRAFKDLTILRDEEKARLLKDVTQMLGESKKEASAEARMDDTGETIDDSI